MGTQIGRYIWRGLRAGEGRIKGQRGGIKGHMGEDKKGIKGILCVDYCILCVKKRV